MILPEFAEFLSNLVILYDKLVIIGDFNVHVDNNSDALGIAFSSLIEYFVFAQNVLCPPAAIAIC